jgi:hypothetical protein
MTLLDCPPEEAEIPKLFAEAQRQPEITGDAPYFTTSQRAAMKRLDALAEVFTRLGDASPGGFRALLKPLIIGQTGSGKSTLVREFARRRGWSFLAIDGGSWIVLGAYTKPPTLRVIRDHIRSAPKTCLMIDEVCKMLPTGDDMGKGWYQAVFSEFLSLADAERLHAHDWTDEDVEKLKHSCFICAGGAFTTALEAACLSAKRGELGFQRGGNGGQTHASKVAEALPPEVFTRFNGEVVVLDPPTRQDYAKGIERIHRSLGRKDSRPLDELLDRAQASGKGVRFMTDYLSSILVEDPGLLPQPDKPKEEGALAPKKAEFDFFSPESMHYCKQTTAYAFRLRAALGQIFAQIAVKRGAIKRRRDRAFAVFMLNEDKGGFLQLVQMGIHHSYGCYQATADDSCLVDSLLRVREAAWEAMSSFGPELDRYGLLHLVCQIWDLSTRVAEMRAVLSDRVAAGRFTKADS